MLGDTCEGAPAGAQVPQNNRQITRKTMCPAVCKNNCNVCIAAISATPPQATAGFLETKLLVPLCLLSHTVEDARKLVEDTLLPSLRQALQMQIDVAQECTETLEKARGRNECGQKGFALGKVIPAWLSLFLLALA